MTRVIPLLAGVLLGACVDPLAEDDVPPRDIVFDYDPATDERPTPREVQASSHHWGDVDTDTADEIAEYDGIDDDTSTVPRLSGFAGGERVWYWDYGPTPTFVAPLWKLVDPFAEGGGEAVPVDHPPIWDVVPGDAAYSPFWRVYTVAITDKYAGERLTSRRALDEALRLGLVLAPQPTDIYVNCPVVDEAVRMQVQPGSMPAYDEEPCPEGDGTCVVPHWAYYRGIRVAYFDTNGARTLDPADPSLRPQDVYELRRESEALPLSEPARGVDITGDDDAADTNDVFEDTPCSRDYSPVHQVTEVFVPADYESIDTASDETQADARNVGDLFNGNGSPRTAIVRGLEPHPGLKNLAIENPTTCPPEEY